MGRFIGMVFKACFPRQVPFRNATFVALAAGMSRLMSRSWWRPMLFGAHKARSELAVQSRVSLVISLVGPDQAFVAIIGHGNFAKISCRLAIFRAAILPSGQIPILTPANVMRVAPSIAEVFLATSVDRAYASGSHVEPPMLPWSEPVAALERSAGSLFLCQNPMIIKEKPL